MQCNVGGFDRTARYIIGIALLSLALLVPMSALWKTVVLIVATIALVTAVVRFCPANYLFGINTCKPKTR